MRSIKNTCWISTVPDVSILAERRNHIELWGQMWAIFWYKGVLLLNKVSSLYLWLDQSGLGTLWHRAQEDAFLFNLMYSRILRSCIVQLPTLTMFSRCALTSLAFTGKMTEERG